MRKFLRNILYIFIALCAFKTKAQIVVNLFPPIANQFSIDDFWKTTFINTNTIPVPATVQFQITDNTNHASVLTMTTTVITFTSGLNQLNANEKANTQSNYGSSQNALALQQTGNLPYGNYTLCVRVNTLNGDATIGSNCEQLEVKPISPLLLSSPYNKDTINTKYPILVWIPPLLLQQSINISYSLRLVELKSEQSEAEAMLQNTPLINVTGLNTNTLDYPVNATPLVEGNTYVWQVAASYQGNSLGITDIWAFTVRTPKSSSEGIIYPVASKSNNGQVYMSDGIFRFVFDNRSNDQKLVYSVKSVQDDKMQDLPALPVVRLRSGVNKINIDLRNYPLKKNSYYYLEVKDSYHQVYKLTYHFTSLRI